MQWQDEPTGQAHVSMGDGTIYHRHTLKECLSNIPPPPPLTRWPGSGARPPDQQTVTASPLANILAQTPTMTPALTPTQAQRQVLTLQQQQKFSFLDPSTAPPLIRVGFQAGSQQGVSGRQFNPQPQYPTSDTNQSLPVSQPSLNLSWNPTLSNSICSVGQQQGYVPYNTQTQQVSSQGASTRLSSSQSTRTLGFTDKTDSTGMNNSGRLPPPYASLYQGSNLYHPLPASESHQASSMKQYQQAPTAREIHLAQLMVFANQRKEFIDKSESGFIEQSLHNPSLRQYHGQEQRYQSQSQPSQGSQGYMSSAALSLNVPPMNEDQRFPGLVNLDGEIPVQSDQNGGLQSQLIQDQGLPNQMSQGQRLPNQMGQYGELPLQMSQGQSLPLQMSSGQSLTDQMIQGQRLPNQVSHSQMLPNQSGRDGGFRPLMDQFGGIPLQMGPGQSLPNQMSQGERLPNQMSQGLRLSSQMSQGQRLSSQISQGQRLPHTTSQGQRPPNQVSQCQMLPNQMSQGGGLPSQMSQGDRFVKEVNHLGSLHSFQVDLHKQQMQGQYSPTYQNCVPSNQGERQSHTSQGHPSKILQGHIYQDVPTTGRHFLDPNHGPRQSVQPVQQAHSRQQAVTNNSITSQMPFNVSMSSGQSRESLAFDQYQNMYQPRGPQIQQLNSFRSGPDLHPDNQARSLLGSWYAAPVTAPTSMSSSSQPTTQTLSTPLCSTVTVSSVMSLSVSSNNAGYPVVSILATSTGRQAVSGLIDIKPKLSDLVPPLPETVQTEDANTLKESMSHPRRTSAAPSDTAIVAASVSSTHVTTSNLVNTNYQTTVASEGLDLSRPRPSSLPNWSQTTVTSSTTSSVRPSSTGTTFPGKEHTHSVDFGSYQGESEKSDSVTLPPALQVKAEPCIDSNRQGIAEQPLEMAGKGHRRGKSILRVKFPNFSPRKRHSSPGLKKLFSIRKPARHKQFKAVRNLTSFNKTEGDIDMRADKTATDGEQETQSGKRKRDLVTANLESMDEHEAKRVSTRGRGVCSRGGGGASRVAASRGGASRGGSSRSGRGSRGGQSQGRGRGRGGRGKKGRGGGVANEKTLKTALSSIQALLSLTDEREAAKLCAVLENYSEANEAKQILLHHLNSKLEMKSPEKSAQGDGVQQTPTTDRDSFVPKLKNVDPQSNTSETSMICEETSVQSSNDTMNQTRPESSLVATLSVQSVDQDKKATPTPTAVCVVKDTNDPVCIASLSVDHPAHVYSNPDLQQKGPPTATDPIQSMKVRFHGETILMVLMPSGKYFIMSEFTKRCFKRKESISSFQLNKSIYTLKAHLQINPIHLEEEQRPMLEKYYNGYVRLNKMIGLISIRDGDYLYHKWQGTKICAAVEDFLEELEDITPRPNAKRLSSGSVIDLCSEEEDTGNDSDVTVLYEEDHPVVSSGHSWLEHTTNNKTETANIRLQNVQVDTSQTIGDVSGTETATTHVQYDPDSTQRQASLKARDTDSPDFLFDRLFLTQICPVNSNSSSSAAKGTTLATESVPIRAGTELKNLNVTLKASDENVKYSFSDINTNSSTNICEISNKETATNRDRNVFALDLTDTEVEKDNDELVTSDLTGSRSEPCENLISHFFKHEPLDGSHSGSYEYNEGSDFVKIGAKSVASNKFEGYHGISLVIVSEDESEEEINNSKSSMDSMFTKSSRRVSNHQLSKELSDNMCCDEGRTGITESTSMEVDDHPGEEISLSDPLLKALQEETGAFDDDEPDKEDYLVPTKRNGEIRDFFLKSRSENPEMQGSSQVVSDIDQATEMMDILAQSKLDQISLKMMQQKETSENQSELVQANHNQNMTNDSQTHKPTQCEERFNGLQAKSMEETDDTLVTQDEVPELEDLLGDTTMIGSHLSEQQKVEHFMKSTADIFPKDAPMTLDVVEEAERRCIQMSDAYLSLLKFENQSVGGDGSQHSRFLLSWENQKNRIFNSN